MDNLVGERLGDFEVVRELGRGGMGVVFEARQVSLNRRVALKVLGPGLGLTPKAVHRFRREAEAAAKLHHTNIVPVYATGENAGLHFYAMELIDGLSLDRVINQLREQRSGEVNAIPTLVPELTTTGPYLDTSTPTGSGVSSGLSSGSAYFDTVARMVADVADALHHAHQNNVLHRDIKPSNLLLSPDGRLSVNDFGLARVLEEPGMTTTGEFMGTPAYMSPEQIAGGRIPVDHRCDIYSLGATLYELLTLRPPFVGPHRDQLLAQVVQKEPTAPHFLNPKVPRDLETICLKCLEKDPDRRYANAKELADDLRRYANRFAILARRTGPLAKFKRWVKRNPVLAASLVGVLLCAGVAAALAYRAHLAELAHAKAQAKHEADMLDEQRRSALEKAILLSRMEDFDGARQAIREAENLGCSAGHIRMLLGQLELYQGHTKQAIDHLTGATELLPNSVAAWSMLAVAFGMDGRNTDLSVSLSKATLLPATTPEDYLFRGHAESQLDPDRALVTLEEAVRRRPSALAHLVYADAFRMHLLDAPTADKAKQALDDIQALKRQLPENPMILSMSASLHAVCFNYFDEVKDLKLRDTARAEGLKDARALERYAKAPKAVVARWIFLEVIGQEEAGVADLRQLSGTTKDLYASYYYGKFLYKRGEFEQAVKAFEINKGEFLADISRVIALAEVPGGHALANDLLKELLARDLSDWDLFNGQLLLRFLGRKDEAIALSRKFLSQPERFPAVRRESFQKALEYCSGRRTADDLIAVLRGSRGDLCNAHLCVALTALAEGNRTEAKKNLQLCLGTRHFEFLPYDLAQFFLSRMEKDATWPPWIPLKK